MRILNRIVLGVFLSMAMSWSAQAAIILTRTAGLTTAEPGAVTFATFDAATNTAIGSVTGGISNVGTPPGSGDWLVTSHLTSDITITLTGLADYFGFLWGSQDAYNNIEFFNGATSVGYFSSIAPGLPFANFAAAGPADYFDRIVFSASGCCFETDNYAARLADSAVPEPGMAALFGLGLAGLGITRRRRAAA